MIGAPCDELAWKKDAGINRVALAGVMRAQGWEINCLYNQETDEQPQLYFSHDFKVGNAYQLAREVRRGLEATSVIIH